ncbi:dephospho-CoA kinase [Aquibacillus albus]|uniref:Dephospho-CoA kinase n=1 Tax=Aquibacillus albus TaxID=1168171 RepID=A0ABS2N1E3_9BACI|nr:dephospho-CoA kinase [Aquibacillus albus]MBM7571954.1 dephospho-CoA kinase [Aquibacillus albus]
MAMVIGLTGGIASGKSTISNMITTFGIPVIDADVISRQVVEPGESAYRKIVDYFGENILHDDRTINRNKLGQIVFSDEEKRKALNKMVHPEVRKTMLNQKEDLINAGNKAVVLDIPLLFESKRTALVDQILVVYVDEDTQLSRLMKRDGFTEEESQSRIKSQMPLKQKQEMADAIIDNRGSLEQSRKQLEKIFIDWKII